jgi:hypothetical protein
MTQVFLHPELDDYFVEYSFTDARGPQGQAVGQRIVDDYAGEKLILLRSLHFDADLPFLREVTFYQKWKFKKLATSRFETVPDSQRARDPEIAEFVAEVFSGDWGRFGYFMEQVRRINDQIRNTLDVVFAGYRFQRRDVIWRFTETRVENLHFDVDRGCDDLELIRLYVNIDDIPRIWYTSGTFTATAQEHYQALHLARFRDQPTDALLLELSKKVLGGWINRGRESAPKHLILFEPGDVWLSDGRAVSHQVVYGRRVVSSLFIAGRDGVPDVTKTFAHRLAVLHRREEEPRAELRAVPARTERPRPPHGGAVTDLRESWEELSEAQRRNTIVRL